MHSNRRLFLASSSLAVAGLAIGARRLHAAAPAAPKKILILGGTGFLGPAVTAAAQARGHSVSLFNRGKTEKVLHTKTDNTERFYGNRDPNKTADEKDPASAKGLESLKGHSWDAVVDTSGYFPRMVKASAELLAPSVKQYVFISSVSVYADNSTPNADTSSAVGKMADETVETFGASFENYGPAKALCEQAAEAAMPGRVTNVRPGLIVGPGDPTGRFTYWPVRVSRGGEVLSPGTPNDPLQMVDVRDLAEWIIHLIESGTMGVFDAISPQNPAGKPGFTMGMLLDACKQASNSNATFTWCDTEFLTAQQVSPWGDMPLWIPPIGESAGFHTRNIQKSLDAGLKMRPVVDTCKATLDWFNSVPEGDRLKNLAGIKPDREAAVLKAWHDRDKAKPAEEPKKEEKAAG
jgi:2'-hydroxyisoflavone reductase